MKAVTVSFIALGIVGIVGAGIVISRFIINEKNKADNETAELSIFDGDNASNQVDLSNLFGHETDNANNETSDKAELDAKAQALAEQQAVAGCRIQVSKKIPFKDWTNYGSVSAFAQGDDCQSAIVRITVKSSEGKTMFSMAAPARDFGISNPTDKRGLQIAMSNSLPDSAVRAAAYPPWINDEDAPYGTEFSRDAYQAIRDKNIPVICLKVPTAPQVCVAYDSATNKMKTLQRG